MILKLHKIGLKGKLSSAISAFINNRKQTTRINKTLSTTRSTKNGLPQGGVISLACFLIYMNDVVKEAKNSTPSLFVDDLSLIASAKRPSDLCKKVQIDLNNIKKWSIENQMVFAPSKFHIINIHMDNKKLTRQHKNSIKYGDETLNWSTSEKLLGIYFDSKLSFQKQLIETLKTVKRSTHRVWKFANQNTGLNTATLLDIFDSYLKPSILYGSALWIFQAYPQIRLNVTPKRPYGETLKKFHSWYNWVLGLCAAAKKSTCHISILVRLGRLPLHYLIAFHSMCDFHAIIHNHSSPEMKTLFGNTISDTKKWNSSIFFKPAQDNITYFTNFTNDGNLLNIKSRKVFHKKLLKAMYKELTQHWSKHKQGRTTFNILQNWTPQQFNRNNKRKYEGYYIRLSFQQNEIKASQHKHNNNIEPTCPRCKTHPETAQHILHDCTSLTLQRNKMLTRINEAFPNIKPTTKNLLTSKNLQPFVLSFLKCCT